MFENEEIYTFIAQEYARSRHFDPNNVRPGSIITTTSL